MWRTKTLFLFFVIMTTVLSSCGTTPTADTPFSDTYTPPPTFTVTPTNCPPLLLDKTPVPVSIKPYLLIVLFEDAYQIENNQDIEMLRRVFQENTEPDDFILMLRMEPLTLNSAVFFSG